MSQNPWTAFGPDPPIALLPTKMQDCILKGPTIECDDIMGMAGHGGYCNEDKYKHTTYCACVNASPAFQCPLFTFTQCANNVFAYKPHGEYRPGPNGAPSHYDACSKATICLNLVEVGGSQNVVTDITQQCGTITNVTNVLKTNPALAVLIFLLFIALIVVLSMRTDSTNGRPPPPPGDADVLF